MPDLVGSTLGRYHIIRQIGQGGMATVYEAYQPGLDRRVAIKVLPSHLASEKDFSTRFWREVTSIGRLEHPNILPVHDSGEEDNIAYLVMKYVAGGTLKAVMGQPLPLAYTVRIVTQIASALTYAHERGIIHRDVKPANVLLADQEWVLLSDFGIAKIVSGDNSLTQPGVGIGTPAYMAPEQGMGNPDYRSDIYSLGVVLYEMLTGRPPFMADTPLAVVMKHIAEPLPTPKSINPDIPRPVEQVILKALAKDPNDRYQSANEMAAALNEAALPYLGQNLPSLGEPPDDLTGDTSVDATLYRPVPEGANERSRFRTIGIAALGGFVTLVVLVLAATALLVSRNVITIGGNIAGAGKTPVSGALIVASPTRLLGATTVRLQTVTTALPVASSVTPPGILSTQTPSPTATGVSETPVATPTSALSTATPPASPPAATVTPLPATPTFTPPDTPRPATPMAEPPTPTPLPPTPTVEPPTPTPPPVRPTVPPSSSALNVSAGSTLFTDDFTSNAAGWSTGKGSDSESYLDGGALHVLVYQTSWTAFSVNQGIVFQDFILTVDATPIQVPDGSGYGVDFRTSKVGSGYNYYSLEILASGSYLFQKCVDGRCTTILGPTASPTIRTGKQANKILIQARGNTFSFYANGTLLATTTDDTLVSGGIAFPVFSAGQPGTHVAFDNVKVWQVRPAGAEEALFDLGNSQPVQNGPANPTLFALDRPRTITLIQNYHLNDGRGAVPGQIMLRAQDGTQYGPWQASGAPSQSGVANAYWVVHPEVVLPADTYVILDSDTSTWSQNSQTDRRGMTLVKGY